jgi:hypothetical protein
MIIVLGIIVLGIIVLGINSTEATLRWCAG